MCSNFDKKYELKKGFELLTENKKYLYLDYDNANWFRTTESGYEFLNHCDGTKTINEIINGLADKYGMNPTFLSKNLSEFILEAIDNYIIVEKEIVTEVNDNDKAVTEIKSHNDEKQSLLIPNDIWIHVSGKCNLNCQFCYSKSSIGNEKRLKLEDIIRFLSDIPDNQRESIVVSGGEPFLYEDLGKLVKNIREMGFKKINVISNGTVGEEMYPEVLPYIDTLQISVDGTVGEIHDKSRGEGSFNKMIKKFALAREVGVKSLVISFTPTNLNIFDLPNMPKFAYDNDIDNIHITRLMPVGRGQVSREKIEAEQELYEQTLKEFIKNLDRINGRIRLENDALRIMSSKRREIGVSYAGNQVSKIMYKYRRKNCGLGTGTISINYDGNIYPCASLHNKCYLLGNILTDKISEVAEMGKEFAQKCSIDNIESCKSCKLKYFCGGGCRACAVGDNNDILGLDNKCESYKKEIFNLMWNVNLPK